MRAKPEPNLESASIIAIPPQDLSNCQDLEKNFSLISLASIGLVVGAPGVIYEFIAVSVCYFAVAASLAELASALPSSAGVHLWASVTAGRRYGRVIGYFAGYWNCLAWVFGTASMSCISGNLCVQMYAHLHPDFIADPWHVFVCSLLVTWLACAIVCLGNSIDPHLNVVGLGLILLGAITSILVCVVMVNTGPGPASSDTVWKNWSADIGYHNGFVFAAGMLMELSQWAHRYYYLPSQLQNLNQSPFQDATAHLAEGIPRPGINVPKAIAAQYVLGFTSAFAYLITILYSISHYDALYVSPFPIAEVYSQATQGSRAATTILLVLLLLSTLLCTVGGYTTCGRTLWTLARVDATPFSKHLSHISEKRHMPLAATLTCAVQVTLLGTTHMGSTTAFNSFIASFILHTSASYIAAIFPYLFRRSSPGFEPGLFYMRGVLGWLVHGWACAYLIIWFVIYCFPYALPTDAQSMNYSVLIWGGLTVLAGGWWLIDGQRRCMWPTRMEIF